MSSTQGDIKPNYLFLVLYSMYNHTKSREKKEEYAKIMDDMTKRYEINGLEQKRYHKQLIEDGPKGQ